MSQILIEKPDAGTQALVQLLAKTAYKIWALVLVGNPCPSVAATLRDMENPQPGDLVFETSTYGGCMRGTDGKWEPVGLHGVGYLIKIVCEPCKVGEWDVAVDGPIPTEQVIYMRLFDGREMRWTNASVLKIPISINPWEH